MVDPYEHEKQVSASQRIEVNEEFCVFSITAGELEQAQKFSEG